MPPLIPAGNPDPAGPGRELGVGEPAHGEQKEELGQVLQRVLVRPLDTVEHLPKQIRDFLTVLVSPLWICTLSDQRDLIFKFKIKY